LPAKNEISFWLKYEVINDMMVRRRITGRAGASTETLPLIELIAFPDISLRSVWYREAILIAGRIFRVLFVRAIDVTSDDHNPVLGRQDEIPLKYVGQHPPR